MLEGESLYALISGGVLGSLGLSILNRHRLKTRISRADQRTQSVLSASEAELQRGEEAQLQILKADHARQLERAQLRWQNWQSRRTDRQEARQARVDHAQDELEARRIQLNERRDEQRARGNTLRSRREGLKSIQGETISVLESRSGQSRERCLEERIKALCEEGDLLSRRLQQRRLGRVEHQLESSTQRLLSLAEQRYSQSLAGDRLLNYVPIPRSSKVKERLLA
ncbi:MAG: hypothetical protein VYD19_09745, partial [Myxococcota bacterium]|nr:hypothetical protein [Myxococcota bacterium]